MVELLQLSQPILGKFKLSKYGARRVAKRVVKVRGTRPLMVECVVKEEESNSRRAVVKNGEDSLDICRVVNGMWQTSGGWGTIERDSAVDAMLKYADSGLTTFDMADICMITCIRRT